MDNHISAALGISPSTSASPGLRRRHSIPTIALHWASVLAIVLAAASGLWRDWSTDETLRPILMAVHKQAGLFVLAALILRLLSRALLGFADHAGPMPAAMRWAAGLAHMALYGLLLALPAIGLALCAASAMDVSLFGLVRLPPLVEDDPDLAATLSDAHVWAAWALLLMVTLHVAAALWHHHVRRDGVLMAMLPTLRRRALPVRGSAPIGAAAQVAHLKSGTVTPLKQPSVDAPVPDKRAGEGKKYGTR